MAGDGVVPVESALLPGSEALVLDDLYHNGFYGRWYGSDLAVVERWWPEDLNVNLVGEHRAQNKFRTPSRATRRGDDAG